jgi:nucleoside-diphosphate-sugar epimerase
MRVFLTGATGFIGSALTRDLLDAGHQVLGLARNEAGAQSLVEAGAQVHRGDVQDLESLRSGAAQADAVIHTAFIHDFSKFQENCEIDRRAIDTLGSVLLGSDRLLIVTSGTGIASTGPGELAVETTPYSNASRNPRVASEEAAEAIAARGGRVAILRLPQVHDTEKQGLITYQVQIAREKGVSAYVGEGRNRWPAAARFDVARLYRLALEKNEPGARYHAVAEEGVPVRDIAEVIGRGLKVPVRSVSSEEANEIFGWLGHFIGWDMPASSEITRTKLGWRPNGPTLLADLENMRYARAA